MVTLVGAGGRYAVVDLSAGPSSYGTTQVQITTVTVTVIVTANVTMTAQNT